MNLVDISERGLLGAHRWGERELVRMGEVAGSQVDEELDRRRRSWKTRSVVVPV